MLHFSIDFTDIKNLYITSCVFRLPLVYSAHKETWKTWKEQRVWIECIQFWFSFGKNKTQKQRCPSMHYNKPSQVLFCHEACPSIHALFLTCVLHTRMIFSMKDTFNVLRGQASNAHACIYKQASRSDCIYDAFSSVRCNHQLIIYSLNHFCVSVLWVESINNARVSECLCAWTSHVRLRDVDFCMRSITSACFEAAYVY